MLAYIGHQVTQAFPFVIAGDFVVRVAEGTFDRISPYCSQSCSQKPPFMA
jgi:hypothetical protein